MRSLSALLLLPVLLLLACGGTKTGGVYRTPMVERGACATILMPGQTMPMPEPGETPGCPGGYASIAGGGVVEEGEKITKTEPHPAVKVLTAPFAILLFPFKVLVLGAKKLGDLTSDEEEVPLDPRLRKAQEVEYGAAGPAGGARAQAARHARARARAARGQGHLAHERLQHEQRQPERLCAVRDAGQRSEPPAPAHRRRARGAALGRRASSRDRRQRGVRRSRSGARA